MACYRVRTTSPTNNIFLLATALAFFVIISLFQNVLISMSLLNDACQRRNLDSRLGGNGSDGDWGLLVGAYNTHQQHLLVKPCASAASILQYGGLVCTQGGEEGSINISISVNCEQQ